MRKIILAKENGDEKNISALCHDGGWYGIKRGAVGID
jgi:hypothetical protein